jgi:hypothetical protein
VLRCEPETETAPTPMGAEADPVPDETVPECDPENVGVFEDDPPDECEPENPAEPDPVFEVLPPELLCDPEAPEPLLLELLPLE